MLRVQASFHAVNLLFMDSHEKMCDYNYGGIKSVLHETSYDEDFNIGFSFFFSSFIGDYFSETFYFKPCTLTATIK